MVEPRDQDQGGAGAIKLPLEKLRLERFDFEPLRIFACSHARNVPRLGLSYFWIGTDGRASFVGHVARHLRDDIQRMVDRRFCGERRA